MIIYYFVSVFMGWTMTYLQHRNSPERDLIVFANLILNMIIWPSFLLLLWCNWGWYLIRKITS